MQRPDDHSEMRGRHACQFCVGFAQSRTLATIAAGLLVAPFGGLAAQEVPSDELRPVDIAVDPPETEDAVTVARLPADGQVSQLPPVPEGEVAFEADQVSYNSNDDSVRASGNVVVRNGARTVTASEVVWNPDTGEIVGSGDVLLSEADRSVRADSVVWNRNTGVITGDGDVRFVDEDGNQLYTDKIELTEEFKAGSMDDLLIALRAGGRLAAQQGERGQDGTIVLSRAAYSGCAIVDPDGCDKRPSWRITCLLYTSPSPRD